MRCKNCKYWVRQERQDSAIGGAIEVESNIGTCNLTIGIEYYESVEKIEMLMGYGTQIAGDNVYVGENFGCINFKPNRVIESKQPTQ